MDTPEDVVADALMKIDVENRATKRAAEKARREREAQLRGRQ